ncbi:uncharacterized protein LOC111624505 [Centruroides sculpturatus]|uniref:uncharacterized protein LOC111624505 n=1 Tax=Centruroides sculpturatus TaxID=218467 RepID=UPI000C6DCC9A|nr:uncharacterized protein LOC111624505 [Centruroides sculpturatus]
MEPALLYAVPVWYEAVYNIHVRRQLLSIQRRFAIQICRSYRTAPTSALLVLAGITPIHIQAKTIAWYWFASRGQFPWLNNIKNYNQANDRITKSMANITTNIQKFGLDGTNQNKVDSNHPHKVNEYTVSMDQEENQTTAAWNIYTDGSRRDEGTGAGVVIMDNNNKTHYQAYYKMAAHCTNVQAELWALLKAIHHIKDNYHKYKGNIRIHTDSRTALNILKHNRRYIGLSADLIAEANNLGKNRKLYFNWIQAHKGHAGNELADKLAKKACTLNKNPSYGKLPHTWVKKQLASIALTDWQNEWDHADTGRKTYTYIPSITQRFKANHYTPEAETTQILTGHGNFAAYLHRFGKTNNNICDCDNTSEATEEHFLYNCPKHDNERLQFMGKCLTEGQNWPPNPPDVFNNRKLWKSLTEFVHKTKTLNASGFSSRATNNILSHSLTRPPMD